jgi:YD repeat-containing protein
LAIALQYDKLYRLTQKVITDPTNGNRTIGYSNYPVGNQLQKQDSVEGSTIYIYDDNDCLLTETLSGEATQYSYDDNGSTTSRVKDPTDQVTYQWDQDHRLVGADITSGSSTQEVRYRYDPTGIRVSSIVEGDETSYLIDTVQPYAQYWVVPCRECLQKSLIPSKGCLLTVEPPSTGDSDFLILNKLRPSIHQHYI